MTNVPEARRRTCYVCNGKVLSLPAKDRHRHNCLSLDCLVHGDLPVGCWQRLAHPFVHDILATIGSYRQSDKSSDLAHAKRVALAQDFLEATDQGIANKGAITKIIENTGRKELQRFLSELPPTSPLCTLLDQPIAVATALKLVKIKLSEPNRRSRILPAEIEIPDDFEKAVTLFADASNRRAVLKRERGHNYQDETALRRICDAQKFCIFLVKQGRRFWSEVAQKDLNEYMSISNKGAGQRAWTFLHFIHGRFPMTQKILRPKNKNKAAGTVVASREAARSAVNRIIKSSDHQVVLAGLFLVLFAQTISRSADLRLKDFRRDANRLQARFAGDWMPLDALTEKFLYQYYPEFRQDGFCGTDEPLFTHSESKLVDAVSNLAGVSLKPLRLAAIANLLHSGITDRGSISHFLGISMPMVAKVEETFYWDLQSTVSPETVEARNEVIRGERRE